MLKEDGIMVIVVPHKVGGFDHRRPVIPLAHLIEDFERGTREDDLAHLAEVLELHDLKRNPEAGSFDEFKKRSENNFKNRSLHHHVFDTKLVLEVMNYIGLQIYVVEFVRPFHIIAVGQKVSFSQVPDKRAFMDDEGDCR